MDKKDNQCSVRFKLHRDKLDLSGQDLITVLDKSINEVGNKIGMHISTDTMNEVRVSIERVTSMTGEVADEVHDYPRATQGTNFRRMSLHFKEGRLISLEWGFRLQDYLPKRKSWTRRLFGKQ